MAEGGQQGANYFGEENLERLKKIRRLRELYKGRFTDEQCGVLLRHKNYDLAETLEFMMNEPRLIRHVIGEEDWQDVGEDLRRSARRNEIVSEVRQFACQPCNNKWWWRVPSRKLVSRCNKCKRKYNALRKDQEYGWARFHCVLCNRDFHDFGMMDLRILQLGLIGKSQAYCFRCYAVCEPLEIIPPLKKEELRRRGRYRRRRWTHTCTAHNCYNRQQPMPGIPVITICVHPKSLPRNVPGLGSTSHQSTGSTVNTFLSQGDILNEYEPSLADISENGNNDNH